MKTIRTQGLPDGSCRKTEFEFYVSDSQVRIPGEHRGPDVCIADHSEQERWLDEQRDLLKPYWDCEWEFVDNDARQKFLNDLAAGKCRILSEEDS